MEYGNFGGPNFEKPGIESADSENTKSKKKKRGSGSAAAETSPGADQKKEEVAKQAESVWGRLIGEKPAVDIDKTVESSKKTLEADHEMVGEDSETSTEESLEALDAEEERYALEAYVDARETALSDSVAEDEPDDIAAARAANLQFLRRLREQLAATDTAAEDIESPINEAYDQTVTDVESISTDGETEDEDPPTAARSSTAGQPVQPTQSRSSGTRPLYQSAMPTAAPSGGARPTIHHYPSSPNVMSPPASQAETVYVRDRRAETGNLLVGGIVGYLIGRRRGRIKTEKRLGAVQKKLEERVEQVQTLVIEKETKIQQLAREQVRDRVHEKVRTPTPKRPESAAARPETSSVSASARSDKRETASRPLGKERAPKAVSELQDKDIMRMSEKIIVGATNLKEVYEAKLISESGLKRLVHEHMNGGDIRRGLAREFMVKEMSFERDPRLRDSILGIEQQKTAAGGSTAAAVEPVVTTPTASAGLPSDHDTSQAAQNQLTTPQQTNVSTGLLVALTLLTLGLAVYAVLLSINR